MDSLQFFGFVIFATLAIASALVVVFHRSPVISALALAFNLVAIAGFYMMLNAQFVALLQVIVYAGAIMVLILFVIMLLAISNEAGLHKSGRIQTVLAPLLGIACAAALGWGLWGVGDANPLPVSSADFGTVNSVGTELFSTFFYAFEVISLLLVVAMIGSVLLAKRRL